MLPSWLLCSESVAPTALPDLYRGHASLLHAELVQESAKIHDICCLLPSSLFLQLLQIKNKVNIAISRRLRGMCQEVIAGCSFASLVYNPVHFASHNLNKTQQHKNSLVVETYMPIILLYIWLKPQVTHPSASIILIAPANLDDIHITMVDMGMIMTTN